MVTRHSEVATYVCVCLSVPVSIFQFPSLFFSSRLFQFSSLSVSVHIIQFPSLSFSSFSVFEFPALSFSSRLYHLVPVSSFSFSSRLCLLVSSLCHSVPVSMLEFPFSSRLYLSFKFCRSVFQFPSVFQIPQWRFCTTRC